MNAGGMYSGWVGRACWYQCSLAHMVTLECALVVWLMRDWRVAKV